MPPQRIRTAAAPSIPQKTERSHAENQERAYIAASRRSDRSIEARHESAKRASEIHKKRTGRTLRVTIEDVLNEEMYEEEDDDLPQRLRHFAQVTSAHPQEGTPEFNRQFQAWMITRLGLNEALKNTMRMNNTGSDSVNNQSPASYSQNSPMSPNGQQNSATFPDPHAVLQPRDINPHMLGSAALGGNQRSQPYSRVSPQAQARNDRRFSQSLDNQPGTSTELTSNGNQHASSQNDPSLLSPLTTQYPGDVQTFFQNPNFFNGHRDSHGFSSQVGSQDPSFNSQKPVDAWQTTNPQYPSLAGGNQPFSQVSGLNSTLAPEMSDMQNSAHMFSGNTTPGFGTHSGLMFDGAMDAYDSTSNPEDDNGNQMLGGNSFDLDQFIDSSFWKDDE